MVSLTSPKTFLVYEYILAHPKFTQYQASKVTRVSFGLVNRVTQWMEERGWVAKRSGHYELVDAAGAVLAMTVFRNMKRLQWFEAPTSLSIPEVVKKMPASAVYCLETALREQSGYYHSNRLCAYLDEKQADRLRDSLALNPGQKTTVAVYKPLPVPSTIKKNGLTITNPVRTVIDLACDGKTALAQDLFTRLWGLNLLTGARTDSRHGLKRRVGA